MAKFTVFSFLGTKLDGGMDERRWEKWRPTISLCQQEDLQIGRLELFVEPKFRELQERVRADIALVSPETEVCFHALDISDPWDFGQVYERLADFCAGYPFDDAGEVLAHMTTGTHVAQICLFLLVEANYLPGKLIQTGPPRGRRAQRDPGEGDYQVIDLDLSKYDRLKTRFEQEQVEAQDFLRSGIATKNRHFNALISQLETVALRSKAPILVTGPTGAGKSQLARKVYELRAQRTGLEGDFVEINCATLRGDSAMSALFGHKKGAFTGAVSDRPGLLRQAHKGMLFLDEVGELGLDEQAMLLRAIEEGTFLPVGSDASVRSQFQLIAGTNRDLHLSVREGTFREDLLARINLWTFQLPGLAERREDIEPNLEYELSKFSQAEGRGATFNQQARLAFLKFAKSSHATWNGNFRDLNASIMRMATLAERGRIGISDVDTETARLTEQWSALEEGAVLKPEQGVDLQEYLSQEALKEIDPFDRVQLSYVLDVCQKSRTLSEAGRCVFSQSRKRRKVANDADRLKKYLARFDLTFQAIQPV